MMLQFLFNCNYPKKFICYARIRFFLWYYEITKCCGNILYNNSCHHLFRKMFTLRCIAFTQNWSTNTYFVKEGKNSLELLTNLCITVCMHIIIENNFTWTWEGERNCCVIHYSTFFELCVAINMLFCVRREQLKPIEMIFHAIIFFVENYVIHLARLLHGTCLFREYIS